MQILSVYPLSAHHPHQRKVRILGFKLFQRHLVVVSLRIAQFCAALAYLGQLCLNLHDILHLLGSCTLTKAKKLEHLDNVLLKSFTDIRCRLIVFKIVLFLTQGEPTLINVQNILCGILIIGTETTEEELLFSVGSQFQLNVEQLLGGLGCLELLDQRHQRSHALIVTTRRVHCQLIKIAELLLYSSLFVAVAQKLCENSVNTLVVILLQAVEAAITRISSGKRITLHPSTTCILIEIITRTRAGIEIGFVQPRSERCLCHCHQRH